MIHFTKVRWKNLLSYGNQFTELQLDRSPSTMITGVNGSGKSTVLEALCFGLFGKPFRKINKPQLVNTKNGRELLVEVEFKKAGDEYLIRRGTKPEVFEIIKNGVQINQPGSSRDYQAQLENSILKFEYSAFTQLVAVGKATHVSFMKLDSNKRRQFIESILSLLVFSNMNRLHATKTNELKERTSELRSQYTVTTERVTMTQKYIKDLEEQVKRTAQADRKSKLDQIAALNEEIRVAENELAAISDKLIDVSALEHFNKQERELGGLLNKLGMKVSDNERDLRSLEESESCYACGQLLKQEERAAKIETLKNSIGKLHDALGDLQDKKELIARRLNELYTAQEFNEKCRREMASITSAIQTNQRQISLLDAQLNEKSDIDLAKIDEQREKLVEHQKTLNALIEEREQVAKLSEYYGLIASMLKDSGIKATIIKRFIPIINHYINQNLAKLDFFAKFTLDENFEETIQARGIDTLSYHNFSEGEKLRIDMAILLAWREIAKAQNNMTTNLLIFDEIMDSSIDGAGAEALGLLLNELRGLNIFIITHTPEKIADKLKSSIIFKQEKGFSKMVVPT